MVAWCCPIVHLTKLGRSDQGASSSPGENTRLILESCCTRKCFPKTISGGVDILDVSYVSFV